MKTIIILLLSIFPAFGEQFGLFTYEVINDQITITDYPEDATGQVEIPNKIEGLPVTGIGHEAFNNCASLTSIIIPNQVTWIGRSFPRDSSHAFSGCRSLELIEIAPGNASYVSIDGVVFNKAKTVLVLYPPGKAGDYLIPEGVLRFIDDIDDVEGGAAAFGGCSLLTTLTLPASFSYFAPGGFTGCTSLQTIQVKEANPRFTSVDGVLFNKEVTELLRYPPGKIGGYRVLGSITKIDWYAFSGCTGLTTVSIPDNVTTILDSPFSGCSSLTTIDVDPLNPNYCSLDGVFFDKNKTTLIQYPPAKSGGFETPGSVFSIYSLQNFWGDFLGIPHPQRSL